MRLTKHVNNADRHPIVFASGSEPRRHSAGRFCWTIVLAAVLIAAPGAAGANDAPPGQTFELKVVGPDRKPVSGAVVEFRTTPRLTREQVRQGAFVTSRRYGTEVRADETGGITVVLPATPSNIDVFVDTPGYGPYCASWSSGERSEAIPSPFTAVLEAGWSVGGVVVDEDGKPVEGATVHPHIEFKKRPGDSRQFAIGTQRRTDAAGAWVFDCVPASMNDVRVEINHPAHMPARPELSRSEFGIARGGEPKARITLKRGLTIRGRVTDDQGRPIAGARVHTRFINNNREALSDADGRYQLVGCEPLLARLVASARGRAFELKEVRVAANLGPVDFTLSPGGTIRVRVLDSAGKPVPRARIFFQRWRGAQYDYFELDGVNQYADARGVWVWNEAPADGVAADICPPEGAQLRRQPLVPRAEEYVFRLPPNRVVTGNVTDAETGKPIRSFRVIPGSDNGGSGARWDRHEGFVSSDGRYRLVQEELGDGALVRIEAKGYEPAISRKIRGNEEAVAIDFALRRRTEPENREGIVARVMTADVQPAEGAKVALVRSGSQVILSNGDIENGSIRAERAETDARGRFELPAQDRSFLLIITHPQGFAFLQSTPDWPVVRIIRLTPWARAEGTFRIGTNRAARIPMRLQPEKLPMDPAGRDGARVIAVYETTTGQDGTYHFERVFPGTAWIGRRLLITVNDGSDEATSACAVKATFESRKTLTLNLGGNGRRVQGKLIAPAGQAQNVPWSFALISVTHQGERGAAASISLTATVDPEGAFHIDDVPPGAYSLSVHFPGKPGGVIRDHRFVVRAEGDGTFDVGELKLKAP